MRDCLDELETRLKNTFSDEDIETIKNRLMDATARALDNASDLFEELENTRNELENDFDQQAKLKEYHFYDRLAKKQDTLNDIMRNIKRSKPFFETMHAKESGIQFKTIKGRYSRELQIRGREEQILDGFKKDLADSNLLQTCYQKEHEDDIATSIATGQSAVPEEIDPKITHIGKIVNKYYDMIDREYSKRGVFIKKLEGRVAKNYHDPIKLLRTADSLGERTKDNALSVAERKEKAFQRWFNFTKELVDIPEAFGQHVVGDDAELERLMREDWNQITDPEEIMGGSGNIQSKLSKRRTYRWKTPTDALKYIQEYGMGTLSTTIEREFRSAAKNIASLDAYGLDRNSFLDSLQKSVKKIPEIANKESLATSLKRIKKISDSVDGKLDADSSSLSAVGGNIRAAISIAKLGGVMLRSIPDLALHTLEARRVYGSFMYSAYKTLINVFKPLSAAEKELFADLTKSWVRTEIGNVNRFSFTNDGEVGLMSKMQRLAFKINGMQWWDKSNRVALSASLARHLALNKDKTFEEIEALDKKFGSDNVNIFKSYNISADEWNAFRKTPSKLADNKGYLLPESAREIPDSDIRNVLKAEGRKKITQNDIDKKRADIEFKWLMYFKDRADYVILRPSAYTKNLLFANTKSGTILGQIIRMMMQFKAYSAAYIEKPLGSLIRGRGAETLREAFFKDGSRGDLAGLGQLIAYTTLLGYVGNQAINLSRGITPAAPDDPRAIKEALAAGGGLSYVGDLVLGGNPRFQGGTLQQIAGPAVGDLSEFIDDFVKAPVDGESSPNRATNAAFHFVKGNIPFVNLFYTKYLLDYFILNRMQNAITPGYTARKKAALQQNGQDYFLPPV